MTNVRQNLKEIEENEKHVEDIREKISRLEREIRDISPKTIKLGNSTYEFNVRSDGELSLERRVESISGSDSIRLYPEVVDALVSWLFQIGYIEYERVIADQLTEQDR